MKLKKHKKIHDGAGFVLYREANSRFEVLILVKESGRFDIPKGHQDLLDVNNFTTAQRECFEETGIFIEPRMLLSNEKFVNGKLVIFCALTDQNPEINKNPVTGKIEHIDFFWASATLAQAILPKYLANAVKWSTKLVLSNT